MRSRTYELAAKDGTDVAATFSFTVAAASAHSAVTPSAVIGFAGTSAPVGQWPHGGLVMDATGNMYGTTEFGGAHGVGNIFKIDASSHALSQLATFGTGSSDVNGPERTLTIDSSGNLFGTGVSGGTNGVGGGGEGPPRSTRTRTAALKYRGLNGGGEPRRPSRKEKGRTSLLHN